MRLQAPFAMRHAPGASTDPQPVIRVPSTAAPAPRPWQRAPRRPRPSRWVPWPLNPTASAGLSTAPGPWPRPAAATRPAGQPHRGGAPAATGARLMSGHHTLQRHYRSLGGQNGVDKKAEGWTEMRWMAPPKGSPADRVAAPIACGRPAPRARDSAQGGPQCPASSPSMKPPTSLAFLRARSAGQPSGMASL